MVFLLHQLNFFSLFLDSRISLVPWFGKRRLDEFEIHSRHLKTDGGLVSCLSNKEPNGLATFLVPFWKALTT